TNACDEGSACTTGDVCAGGVCAGTPITCSDGNPCTTDSCNPASGCVFANNTNPCDDGNACTSGDTCALGACAGTPITCNDNNPCTTDSCNPASGCVFANNTNPCDDGDVCTTGDTCNGGSCTPTGTLNCSDGNLCTTDSCNPTSGCVHTNNTLPCDDGNYQTCNDTCSGGVCAGIVGLQGCIDHFKCYGAKADAGTPFTKVTGVELDDIFETDKFFDVIKPTELCTPVDKNGVGIADPTTHLECYRAALTRANPRQGMFHQTDLTSTQPFGTDQLTATRAIRLCVPTRVNGQPSALNLDAFKCYKTKLPVGATPFNPQTVTLADQF